MTTTTSYQAGAAVAFVDTVHRPTLHTGVVVEEATEANGFFATVDVHTSERLGEPARHHATPRRHVVAASLLSNAR